MFENYALCLWTDICVNNGEKKKKLSRFLFDTANNSLLADNRKPFEVLDVSAYFYDLLWFNREATHFMQILKQNTHYWLGTSCREL